MAAILPISAPASPATPPLRPHGGSAFRLLLSELNPLQYVPVVGTIYRAITHDTIPERARMAGSMVVSFLTGGPIGVAMNVGTTLLERATGIDPEKIGAQLLAAAGIGQPAASGSPTVPPQEKVTQRAGPASSAARPWSPAQLAAYGVRSAPDGTPQRGSVSGADVLNGLELARLAQPASLRAVA